MTAATLARLEYLLVDVFSDVPYNGNGLAVLPDAGGLGTEQMRRITQELRYFETIFLTPTPDPRRVRARVFDLMEELPFAGHPVIGAAVTLHMADGGSGSRTWQVELPGRTVTVTTERNAAGGYFGLLDQGAPEFLGVVSDREPVARAFGLEVDDLSPELPLEVVSTGLRYLIVPLRPGVIGRARIREDITPLVRRFGAEYAVLLEPSALEVRHWNNDGIIEDVATGSAAGTIGAYLLRHARVVAGESFTLQQGRFTGRPSRLMVRAEGRPDAVERVLVGGAVVRVGHGTLEALPSG